MSNYRVRQVMRVAKERRLKPRQQDLLVGLATWLGDESRTVRVGFPAVEEAAAMSLHHAKLARRELADAGLLTYTSSHGRGRRTLWDVVCLPEKGAPHEVPLSEQGKGAPCEPEKGHPAADKRGTPSGTPRLNLRAKPLPLAGLLASAAPGATEREIENALTAIQARHARGEIRDERAWLRAVIERGDAGALIEDTRNGHGAPGPPPYPHESDPLAPKVPGDEPTAEFLEEAARIRARAGARSTGQTPQQEQAPP